MFSIKNKSVGPFKIFLGLISVVFMVACSKPSSPSVDRISPLQMFPELSGDYGVQTQIGKTDKVFSFKKEDLEDVSENTAVSLTTDSNAFYISSKNGCERELKKRETCFVRVRFDGNKIYNDVEGIKTATLQVGSLTIPLSADFQPLSPSALEGSLGGQSLQEDMIVDCFSGLCRLVFSFSNNSLVDQVPATIVVPQGYVIQYNSCNRVLKAGKKCFVRLHIEESVADLAEGEIVLNTGTSSVSTNVTVSRQEDRVAPSVSVEVLDSEEINNEVYLEDSIATVRLSFSDNFPVSRGIHYSVARGSSCSTVFKTTTQEIEEESVELLPNVDNNISFWAKDALGNQSDCVTLSIKNLNLVNYQVSVASLGAGLGTISPSTTVLYDGSYSVVYSPPTANHAVTWGGACLGTVGNSCNLTSIRENKNVTATVGCVGTHTLSGANCLLTKNVVISANSANANIFSLAGSPSVASYVVVTINSGVDVYSTSSTTPALRTGSFPAGSIMIINNNGRILGQGGNGAAGQGSGSFNVWTSGIQGQKGGDALELNMSVSINNLGSIFGGGGGGSSAPTFHGVGVAACGGGGGGGQGYGTSLGGPVGACIAGYSTSRTPGGNGNINGPGGGGASGGNSNGFTSEGGGAGGAWGKPGANSGVGIPRAGWGAGAATAGGAAGNSVKRNGFTVNWLAGENETQVRGPQNN